MTAERVELPEVADLAEAATTQAATEMRELRQLATKFLEDLKTVVDASEKFDDPYVFRRAVEIMGAMVLRESMGEVILHDELSIGTLEDQLSEGGEGLNICSKITANEMGIDQANNCHKYIVAAILDVRGRVSFVIRINSEWDDLLMLAIDNDNEAYSYF